jgi:hypothetical protein
MAMRKFFHPERSDARQRDWLEARQRDTPEFETVVALMDIPALPGP